MSSPKLDSPKSGSYYEMWHSHPHRNKHHFVAFFIVALGVTFGLVNSAEEYAQQFAVATPVHNPAPSVRTLTNDMLATIQVYEMTPPEQRAQLLELMRPIIESRNAAIEKLSDKHPDKALLELLPEELTSTFPHEIAVHLENQNTLSNISLMAAKRAANATSDPSRISMAAAAEGGVGCVEGATTISISPAQQVATTSGATRAYALTVENSDSEQCPPATYNVTSDVPRGWTSSIASSTLMIKAGSHAMTTLTTAAAQIARNGLYAIRVQVHGSTTSHSKEAQATYIVYVRP